MPQQPRKTPQKKPATPTRPQQAAQRKRPANRPNTVSIHHGAEVLAALTVVTKKASRLKIGIILLLATCLIASLTWNSIQSATRPEPRLLATSPDGRIMPLPLLDEPIETRSTIIDWSRRHIPKMYDFNFANYQGELNKNLEFMRQRTLNSFIQMLNSSGIMDQVRDNFQIVRGTVDGEPIILSENVQGGIRFWIVEIPISIHYDSGDRAEGRRQQLTQEVAFRAWIARDNPMEYPGGLILANFEVLPRSSSR